MRKYSKLLILLSILAGPEQGACQKKSADIPVISKLIGTTVDIPEQEYYQVFEGVDGFLTAQFQQTSRGYVARIRTEKGWETRQYSPRAFYELGLAVDLKGPIDPLVLAGLRGQIAFDKMAARITLIPAGVRMSIARESARTRRGRFIEFSGIHFQLQGRGGKIRRVPLADLKRISYRDFPVADSKKDARIYAAVALCGLVAGMGWNRLGGIEQFDARWHRQFLGALLGLAASPFVVHRFRVKRAPVHTIYIEKETRKKLNTYTFLESY